MSMQQHNFISGGMGEEDWSGSAIFGLDSQCAALISDAADQVGAVSVGDSQLRLAASVFSNAHDAILIADRDGVILDVNRAYTRITGWVAAELQGGLYPLLCRGGGRSVSRDAFWRELDGKGVWRGEIQSRRRNGDAYTELSSISAVRNAQGELTHYVVIFSDISALKESERKLAYLAYHDALTGLPNRVLLGDRIRQALIQHRRKHGTLAICFIDLDNFKPVNDHHGHQEGDRLLINVAQRLSDALRTGDTVARLGGDEFALLLCDLESPQEAAEILARLLVRLAQPYSFNGIVVSLSASIGYTLVPGDEGDPDTLLRHADQAMYQAKQLGRNRFNLFDVEHALRLRSQRETLSRIERALQDNEFVLYFQPKVNLREGRVVGAEVLIRWRHQERGLLSPVDFLLPLGDHQLLVDIGDWVIRNALAQLAAWRAKDLHLPLSVNIAGCHLLHESFVSRLSAHLARHPDVAPGDLELEILETAALDDIAHVSQVIGQCRKLGVELALDDFGTGYSSLLYLKRLAAKTLKIDQSFVRDLLNTPEGADTLSGIMALAQAFKRKVVAEGVEYVEQGIVLLRLGCDVVQGYAIARPMPASEVDQWVAAYRPDPAWHKSLTVPWRRSDFPLVAAEVEERRWLRRVMTAIERGDAGILERRLASISQTSLGRWLERHGNRRYGHLPQLQAIPARFEAVRNVSSRICELLGQAKSNDALALLPEQREQSLAMIEALDMLREAIAYRGHRSVQSAMPSDASTFG